MTAHDTAYWYHDCADYASATLAMATCTYSPQGDPIACTCTDFHLYISNVNSNQKGHVSTHACLPCRALKCCLYLVDQSEVNQYIARLELWQMRRSPKIPEAPIGNAYSPFTRTPQLCTVISCVTLAGGM